MVESVNESYTIRPQLVPQGQRRMVKVLGFDRNVIERQGPFDQVVVVNGGTELLELQREIRILHLPGQRLAQRRSQSARRIAVPFIPGPKERSEERQSLYMIPVGMTDENVALDRFHGCRQFLSQREGTGAHVQHDKRSCA